MSYKRTGPADSAYNTPIKRQRTSIDTPGTNRSTASYKSRSAGTPSAYETFPAQEFNSWIDSIKAKASAALRENKALDEEFKRGRAIEQELELKRQQERDRLAQLIKDQVEREKQEQDEELEGAYRALQSATNSKSNGAIAHSDSESPGSIADGPIKIGNGYAHSSSGEEDGADEVSAESLEEDEEELPEENESEDDLATGIELNDDEDGEYYYDEEPTFAHSTRARQLHIESPESDRGTDSDQDDDEQEYAEDDELARGQNIFSNDISEPLEIMSSEEEEVAGEDSAVSDVESAPPSLDDEAAQEQTLEAESDADNALFTDEGDDFEPADAGAFEAIAGFHTQEGILDTQASQLEELTDAEFESDVDADANAPEAFVYGRTQAGVYDTEASRDWLQPTDHSATVEGSNELPMPAQVYEDEANCADTDDVAPHDSNGMSHSRHEIPVVRSANSHQAGFSDALTEEEIEDEKYHMWKDEMTKSDAMDPISEEEEVDAGRVQGYTQDLARPQSPDAANTMHSHPPAHPGHEHEHHANTLESTTEELHPEILPAVSANEIEDLTTRNFEVVKDVDDVVTSIREKDKFDQPVTRAQEEALEPEMQFLKALDKTNFPTTTEVVGGDELQDFPDDLELNGMSDEEEQTELQMDDSSPDNKNSSHSSDHPEANWESDSDDNGDANTEPSGFDDDPEIIEDEGSIEYEEEDESRSRSDEEVDHRDDLVLVEEPDTHHEIVDRPESPAQSQVSHGDQGSEQLVQDASVPTEGASSEQTSKPTTQDSDLVHVLRDGAEYVDDDHLRDHHYTPRLQSADAPVRHRRQPSKSSQS